MPKARRERSVSFDRSRGYPFPCSSSRSKASLPKNPLEDPENMKEWEDTRCPVCMEHPHNAILLLCSSHEKGCRPFMCDTSYRHSNCFDQFRKSFGEAKPMMQRPEDTLISVSPVMTSSTIISESTVRDLEGERSVEGSMPVEGDSINNQEKPKLVCPLCRGQINGCTVVESARRFMNSKSRSCASETCDFSGNYTDIRKHARLVHPLTRPTEADPERQRNWRRLERQRDLGDLLSTLHSSFSEERIEDNSTLTIDDGGWLTVYFLVRFIRPGNTAGRSSNSRTRTQIRRSSRQLWGEPDGETDSRDDVDESSDSGQSQVVHYERRQRRRRSTPED
ncbi:uncharacterized protein LOC111411128 [Olea europaea var. sylvestris]|uniref:uncharacterized protein LOC111411128 n=1 Tax=Olea europaea var. sylvestris TaxID=158386 RepID=UPI000C1D6265|nr:uncharacterized protein LOC111411128 [Olea europaea var. sylvestris]XP_022897463.1 uncharacterized protein LOC111411128 [Olea europaea var. sylvestris]XP_022897467.1 uncharacterized protein LOC111411128 [Olea europaea var. sylvestris]